MPAVPVAGMQVLLTDQIVMGVVIHLLMVRIPIQVHIFMVIIFRSNGVVHFSWIRTLYLLQDGMNG